MEEFENSVNKEFDIKLVDFPFICRICLTRGDLRLFEEEECLLDIFVTITKIDVRSTVNFPPNVCKECINKLIDISLFIDISKYNDSRQEMDLIPKKEIENAECEEDIYIQESEICRICSSSCPIPFEEKVEAEAKLLERKSILCKKCIDQVEKISSFISLSLCNNMKLENIIGRYTTLKTEDCSVENSNETSTLCNEMKFESYSDENASCYESKDLKTAVQIKKEDSDSPEGSVEQNHQNGWEFCCETNSVEKLSDSDPCKTELSIENHLKISPKQVNLDAGVTTKKFQCDLCKKCFSLKEVLKRHLLLHTGKKPFKCDYCEKSFAARENLRSHIRCHTGERPFKCGICEKSFIRRDALDSHLRAHAGEKQFKCDICEKSFTRKTTLKSHSLTHTGEKPFKCDHCDESFAYRNSLNCHVLRHTGEKAFKCDICEKSFTGKNGLKSHLLSHTGEKPCKCDVCGKSFGDKSSLKKHSRSHGDKTFECDRCEKSFADERDLKRHSRIHEEKTFKRDCSETREKPFQCDTCKKSFTHKNVLTSHIRVHTGVKPYKCVVCEKGFTQHNGLQKHLLLHTGEKPFQCDVCGTRFAQKASLHRHSLVHTGQKPFKCDVCGRSFTQRMSMKRHLSTHTKEKISEGSEVEELGS